MPKARCPFRGTEVTRLCVAAEKAGKKVARVEYLAGKIILVFDNGDKNEAESSEIKL
jgi:hypothetical protein